MLARLCGSWLRSEQTRSKGRDAKLEAITSNGTEIEIRLKGHEESPSNRTFELVIAELRDILCDLSDFGHYPTRTAPPLTLKISPVMKPAY